MKKKYFYLLLTAVFYSVFLCGCDRNVKIDEKHFPDDIFREYVETNYDTDSNGVLSAE